MIPVLRTKSGVTFDRIAPGGFRILSALDQVCRIVGKDLVITAGTNDHDSGKHPLGEAYDVSVKDLSVADILNVRNRLTLTLGGQFTVLYETNVAPVVPELKAIALVNPEATGAHLHIQVSKFLKSFPPEDGVVKV